MGISLPSWQANGKSNFPATSPEMRETSPTSSSSPPAQEYPTSTKGDSLPPTVMVTVPLGEVPDPPSPKTTSSRVSRSRLAKSNCQKGFQASRPRSRKSLPHGVTRRCQEHALHKLFSLVLLNLKAHKSLSMPCHAGTLRLTYSGIHRVARSLRLRALDEGKKGFVIAKS
jgi:hypothetical protein